PDVGPVPRAAGSVSLAPASDHSGPTTVRLVTSRNSGKSRMRESRTYGSVRAKAEWLSYSTNLDGPGWNLCEEVYRSMGSPATDALVSCEPTADRSAFSDS